MFFCQFTRKRCKHSIANALKNDAADYTIIALIAAQAATQQNQLTSHLKLQESLHDSLNQRQVCVCSLQLGLIRVHTHTHIHTKFHFKISALLLLYTKLVHILIIIIIDVWWSTNSWKLSYNNCSVLWIYTKHQFSDDLRNSHNEYQHFAWTYGLSVWR